MAETGFFVDHATQRADLGDGCYIEFRKELLLGEAAELDMLLVRAREDGSPKASAAANVGFLKAYVTDWRLVDDQGTPRPYSPQAVDELRWEAVRRLMDAIVAGIRDGGAADDAGKAPAAEQTSQ